MNKSSIEKARAEFHGNEFGEYDNPAPSPWVGILGFGRFLWRLARWCGSTAARQQ